MRFNLLRANYLITNHLSKRFVQPVLILHQLSATYHKLRFQNKLRTIKLLRGFWMCIVSSKKLELSASCTQTYLSKDFSRFVSKSSKLSRLRLTLNKKYTAFVIIWQITSLPLIIAFCLCSLFPAKSL